MIYTVPQNHNFSEILLLLQKTNCAPIDLNQQLIFKSTIFNLRSRYKYLTICEPKVYKFQYRRHNNILFLCYQLKTNLLTHRYV